MSGMSYRFSIAFAGFAAFVLLIGLTALAAEHAQSSNTWQKMFSEAGKLYDQGRFTEAAEVYEELLKEGWRASEIYFNLGNAYFKGGRLANAVLNYRRAWYLAPRDPDIRANLQYSLQTAGAPLPELQRHEAILTLIPQRQWRSVLITFWWFACAMVIAGTWIPRYRGFFGRVAVVSFGVCLISLAGIWTWRQMVARPEYVVVGQREEARFAPLDNAVVHFVLPQGAIVRQIERSGDWLKISADRKDGWMRLQNLVAVPQ